jgi:hypothetical protein
MSEKAHSERKSMVVNETAKMDPEQEASRAAILASDSERATSTAPPVGVAAAAASNAQHQHVADAIQEAALQMYHGHAAGEATVPVPWPCFKVTDALEQVVNGTIYFLKVRVSDDPVEFVQLRAYMSLFGDDPVLVALKKGDAAAGPITYFEPA